MAQSLPYFSKSDVQHLNHSYLLRKYFLFLKKIFSFLKIIYIWLHWVCIALLRLSFAAVRGPLVAVASRCGHRLQGVRASVVLVSWLSSCDSGVQLPFGMRDLPGPGFEPTPSALAGGFLSTTPPGKSKKLLDCV